jgi:uncharacterized protein (DUF1330 family)
MAKGYLVANVRVLDPERYGEYRNRVPAVIEQYGGRYLARAGALRKLENAEGFDRVVVIEFDSLEAAERFYRSPEYASLLQLRTETTRSEVVLVEGV